MTDEVSVEFHGTNGWFDSDLGCTSCVAVYDGQKTVVFDAGTGIRRLNRSEVENRPMVLFLSHLHLDHSVGLHFLPYFSPSSLKIILPADLVWAIKVLADYPFSKTLCSAVFPVSIHGVISGKHCVGGVDFTASSLEHTTEVLGYKVAFGKKSLAYCVDTKPCPGLDMLADQADVMICDCGLQHRVGFESHCHMTPEEGLAAANKCGVGRLILTHFGCTRYKTYKDRSLANSSTLDFAGDVLIAYDGMRLKMLTN